MSSISALPADIVRWLSAQPDLSDITFLTEFPAIKKAVPLRKVIVAVGLHDVTLTDQFRDDVLPLRCGADHAGLAVVERRHGVEEMRHMARPGVKETAGRLIVRIRVGDGDHAQLAHGAAAGENVQKSESIFICHVLVTSYVFSEL